VGWGPGGGLGTPRGTARGDRCRAGPWGGVDRGALTTSPITLCRHLPQDAGAVCPGVCVPLPGPLLLVRVPVSAAAQLGWQGGGAAAVGGGGTLPAATAATGQACEPALSLAAACRWRSRCQLNGIRAEPHPLAAILFASCLPRRCADPASRALPAPLPLCCPQVQLFHEGDLPGHRL
jgi:hypothetical protein